VKPKRNDVLELFPSRHNERKVQVMAKFEKRIHGFLRVIVWKGKNATNKKEGRTGNWAHPSTTWGEDTSNVAWSKKKKEAAQ